MDHSHLMLRFEHARWTHYKEGLIPYRLLGKRTPKDRLPEHQRPSRGTVDKARRFGGRSQNGAA
jgi:hypothetical protein